jgi:hypothetical protein
MEPGTSQLSKTIPQLDAQKIEKLFTSIGIYSFLTLFIVVI